MQYTVERSKRKTIAIYITKEAKILVRAPFNATKESIEGFLSEKSKWIANHIQLVENNSRQKSSFNLNYGDKAFYLGREYPIQKGTDNSIYFDSQGFTIPPGLLNDEIKNALIQMYKYLAKKKINERIQYFAKQMNLAPTAIRITSAKTRWGSCSSKNSLNFSWRLVMAEEKLIDYVVVHELAHIMQHNHSEMFWNVVASVLPDYRERENRFKELEKRLSEEEWD